MTPDRLFQTVRDQLTRPIVLVGLPASGKTVLGQGVSRALGLDFIDTDCAIADHAGQTVPAIFAARGEPAFRDLESEIIRTVFRDHAGPCVISTGGGAVLRPENRDLLFGDTHAVWVRASIPVLLARIARDTHRPLLRDNNREQVLLRLREERYPLYENAAITVDTDDRIVADIVPDIIRQIQERFYP